MSASLDWIIWKSPIGFAELHAGLGVVDAEVERPFAMPRQMGRSIARSRSSPLMTMENALVLLADQVGGRHAAFVEHKFAGLAAAEAHLGQLLRHPEAGHVLLDDEGGDAVRAFLRRGLGIDQ